MRLSFHGAARAVTGSCHLVECAGTRLLIDCGLVQGDRELQEANEADFAFDPRAIDFVLLTHAHLDHRGRLPLLVKRGFRGEVIATAASCDLARLVLLDAANLQEEEHRRRVRGAERRGHAPGVPLYTLVDTLDALDLFGRKAEYGKPLTLVSGIRATFHDAGHILGSAFIRLELEEGGRTRRVLFSGDLGNEGRPLLAPPAAPPPSDIVVLESTYGDRLHRPFEESVEELYAAVSATVARGGNAIIPTFALERAQEILFFLGRGIAESRLPPSLPVFLDSPLAISATEIFRRHPEGCAPEIAALLREGRDPFDFPGLHRSREVADSMAINRIDGGAVILAGAGMCTGGRIRHHLRHNLWRKEAAVIFVGFAARGTLARRIIDGHAAGSDGYVTLFGEDVRIRAGIHTINGFSAHAGQAELAAWRRKVAEAERTFLVHGEEGAMSALKARLPGCVLMPELHESFAM